MTSGLTLQRFFRYWMTASLVALIAVLANPLGPLVEHYIPRPEHVDVAGLLAMAALHGVALAWWVAHTGLRQWRFAAWVAGVYVLLGAMLVQAESWLYLSLWNSVLKPEAVGIIFLHEVVFGVLMGVLAALAFWREPGATSQPQPLHGGKALAWRWIVATILYVVLYGLAGYFIAIPLSGDAFKQVYGELHLPDWAILVQFVRGAGWVAVVWMILRNFSGPAWTAKLGVALLITFIIDAGLLVENTFFPTQLRLAHFVEIGVSMLAFGWLAAGLLLAKRAE